MLDTHAFLWWFSGDDRMSHSARAFVNDPDNVLLVSAASIWEIATKYRLGRLPEAAKLVQDIEEAMEREAFQGLPLSLAHGERAGFLPEPVRDPFDRMLIAQAQAEDLALVSNERIFDSYGVRRIW